MSKQKLFATVLFIISCAYLCAQENHERNIKIKEVTVTEKVKVKQSEVGARLTKIENAALKSNQTRSLSELLTEASSLQVKSMGQGALSTVSIRGASSSHTQVLWNGISLNSPQLGNFDFSQIPVYFIDNVNLYHGGGAQGSGSGAIGGSVNLANSSNPVDNPVVSLLSEFASNSTYSEALTFRASKNKFTFSTRAFYQQSKNNFKFWDRVTAKDPKYDRRKNADYKQAGVMQEVYYRNTYGDLFSGIAWWHFDDRSLPQMLTVAGGTPKEKIRTNNFRTMLSYDANRDFHHLKGTLAFLSGDSRYTKIFGDTTRTDNANNSVIARADYNFSGWAKFPVSASLMYRFDKVSSNNYDEKYKTRNAVSLQLMTTYRLTRKLHFDLKTTGEMIDNNVYGLYNLTGRYRVLNEYLTLKASSNYNYRVPSLNDLYWNPGGNPDLKPEKGFSSDFTLLSEPSFGNFDLRLEATYFLMNINNWIMWIPKGNGAIWEPVNFNKVRSQGAEVNAMLNFHCRKSRHSLTGNYSFTSSVDNSGRDDGAIGVQIPYIPRNRWNAGYRYNYSDKLWANYLIQFTDIRNTSADASYQTPAYTTHNAEVGYNLSYRKKVKMSFSLKVDNIFNAYYESTQYYPMPLRMFWGRVVLTIG
ncbi:MAG: TonB-dependent receptor plug domain-containing protein [Bacteroidales bacterium]